MQPQFAEKVFQCQSGIQCVIYSNLSITLFIYIMTICKIKAGSLYFIIDTCFFRFLHQDRYHALITKSPGLPMRLG